MTPEGRIKLLIRKVLDKYKHSTYIYMPVPGGYGKSSLDYLGFCRGLGFAVEAKRPGGKPTTRQEGIIDDIKKAGAVVFVVNDTDSLQKLDDWLAAVTLP